MVEQQPSKLNTRVRFPSPAPDNFNKPSLRPGHHASKRYLSAQAFKDVTTDEAAFKKLAHDAFEAGN
jgi:hypothetical protein